MNCEVRRWQAHYKKQAFFKSLPEDQRKARLHETRKKVAARYPYDVDDRVLKVSTRGGKDFTCQRFTEADVHPECALSVPVGFSLPVRVGNVHVSMILDKDSSSLSILRLPANDDAAREYFQ